MVTTRAQEAAQRALWAAISQGDASTVLDLLREPAAAEAAAHSMQGGLTSVHWAAMADCHAALPALVAAAGAAALNGLLASPCAQRAWLLTLMAGLSEEQRAALLPGCTPLTIACR